MLIHNTLPKKYFNSIDYVYNYYKNKNLEGNHSVHYWINQVNHPTLQYHLNRLRNSPYFKLIINTYYPNYKIISVHTSDEIYLSVSPSKRIGSDVTLSDCHYDAPFRMVPQGGNIFLRAILALNENNTVYTQVNDKTSRLTKGDFNIIDYNNDFHCVKGKIPKNKDRIILKLHFVAIPRHSPLYFTRLCIWMNDGWTHFSREMMRDSIKPKTLTQKIKKNLVMVSHHIYTHYYYYILFALIIIAIKKKPIR